ncbi:uncharacterized protein LOC128672559 [Plodia interpunctella]|uniref:uncharacterized protein LOC128672559 n=1 Tax=Plodia interpunctella TaxID=58824 RepID=UPI002367F676|nr:uncharacterized protein LOC128672559 [Plodia interpunctella]
MESLLQPVLESYSKFSIEKKVSPSYVQMYTKNKNEIALVCIKNKTIYNHPDATEHGNKCEQEELDLTGSPLKLDLSLHTMLDDTLVSDEPQLWSKEEAVHLPVGIDKARDIANLYHKSLASVTKADSLPMWILTNPASEGKPLLLTLQSDERNFARGIVSYEGAVTLDEVDMDILIQEFCEKKKLSSDMVTSTVDCKFLLSGVSYGSHSTDELLNAPHSGVTELHCEWPGKMLQIPFISCKVRFEQEVIVGHLASPCNAIWKSVCSLHNINQLLVDMTAAGISTVNLENSVVRTYVQGEKRIDNHKKVQNLLNETETYAYTAESPAGGCVCVTADTASLAQGLAAMSTCGSSNDFTYKLWDVLRDCETADELVTLLIQALKFISSGKIRPFIDANNKTYLSKLVLKLSRGHSQTAKVLKNLMSSPAQALSLVAQVGVEKTMWEYTRVMALLEHSFYIAGIWTSDARSHDSIEQINQTIQDMTMSGDYTLNPFENISNAEHSIRLDCESFYDEDPNELTVDDFASLKKHGLVAEKKDVNEVPLIADEIDISPWKNLLMRFAQVHVCLEHLYRAETCLRADFTNLKPIASHLLEYYVSEKSPIKTVGQVMSDPVQKISMPISNIIVQDHLKKNAFWYRVEINKKDNAVNKGLKRDSKIVYVFSQQPVFPPSVWQHLEPASEEIGEVTTMGEDLKYYITKYVFISNRVLNKLN